MKHTIISDLIRILVWVLTVLAIVVSLFLVAFTFMTGMYAAQEYARWLGLTP